MDAGDMILRSWLSERHVRMALDFAVGLLAVEAIQEATTKREDVKTYDIRK